MTEQQHRATAEQWARLEQRYLGGNDLVCAALELRDRIEALEAATNHPESPDSSLAPAIAWARQLPVHVLCHPNGCDICQRDWPCARLLAEQDAKAESKAAANSKPIPNPHQIRSSAEGAPAGGLVERVAEIISNGDDGHHWSDEARAAILAVAEWLESHNWFPAACWLREEVAKLNEMS